MIEGTGPGRGRFWRPVLFVLSHVPGLFGPEPPREQAHREGRTVAVIRKAER